MTKPIKSKKMRKGMAMLDLILAIGAAGLFVAGIIWMWGGAKTTLEGKKLSDKTTVVINGIEKAKSDYNNDAYLASSKANIANITNLKLALGGTKTVTTLAGWSYGCPAGYNSTITVTSEPIKDTEIIDGVAAEVNSKYTDWTAARSGNNLVLTRTNSNCQ